MSKNLEELFCITCRKQTPHEYVESALQDGIKVFDIYQCSICGDKKIQNMREVQDPNYKEEKEEGSYRLGRS